MNLLGVLSSDVEILKAENIEPAYIAISELARKLGYSQTGMMKLVRREIHPHKIIKFHGKLAIPIQLAKKIKRKKEQK